MPKNNLGFRVDKSIYDCVLQECDRTGKTLTEWLTDAVLNALGEDVSSVNDTSYSQDRVEALEQRLASVEQSLAALAERLTEQPENPQVEQSVKQSLATVSSPFPTNWDDLPDDLPDEVLTDFLPPEPFPKMPQEVKLPSGEGESLTLQQVCDRYDLSFSNFSRNAKKQGLSNIEYLRQVTGHNWQLRGKRYYLESQP